MGIIPRFDIFFNNIDNTNVRTQQNSILKALNWKRLYAVEIQHTWRNEYYGEETSVDTLGNKTIYFDYSFPGRHKLLSYVTERKGCYKEYSDYQYGGGMAFNVFKVPDYPNDYTPKDYRFLYNIDFTLPEPVYGSEDHWGYWNGSTFSFSNTVSSVITKKSSSLPHAKAETLKEIIYPTGGKSVFEYELNSYSRVVSPTFTSLNTESGVGGGLRVSKIITYKSGGEIDKIKRYYYTKTLPNNKNSYSESSGILKNKPVYDSYFATKDQTVMYELGLFGDKPLNAGTAWLGLRQSGGFIAQPTNDDSPVIGYSSIFEESLDAGENRLGYIHYQYSNYDEDIWGNSHLDERFLFATASGDTYADQFSSKSQERGRLMAKDYYDADGKKINSIRYKYQKIYGMANEYLLTVHQQTVFFCSDALLTQFGIFSSAFKTYTYSYLPSECIETTYGMTTGAVEKITSFVYNRHKLQIEKITHGSNDEE